MANISNAKLTRWIHITDVQLGQHQYDDGSDEHDALVEELIGKVCTEKPAFVVNSGDMVEGGLRFDEGKFVAKCWRKYQRIIGPLRRQCPVLCCPGNHDQAIPGCTLDEYCRQIGRANKPPYYAVTLGDIHLVLLDLLDRAGEYCWDDRITRGLSHRGAYFPGSKQDRWLHRHLSRGRRAKVMIAVGHHPIFMSPYLYYDTDSSLRFDEITKNLGGLLPQLIDTRFDLYLCGHFHVYERSRHPKLTQVVTGGDDIGFSAGAEEKPNKYSIKFDRRHGYTRFTYDYAANRIYGESIALDGDIIDSWSQKVKV